MIGYIYLTTNLINNKKYIGKRQKPKFDKNYLGSGIYLNKSIQKYGKENFKCEILEKCFTVEELNEKEQYWIAYYNAVEDPNFYNLAKGGSGGQTPCSEETKKKIRLGNLGKIRSPEAIEIYRENQINTVWINNGIKNKKIKSQELSKYIFEGSNWVKGQLPGRINGPKAESSKKLMSELMTGKPHEGKWTENQKNSKMSKKFHWYTNGEISLYLNELEDEVPEGFHPGRVYSKERNEKIKSKAQDRMFITNGKEDKLIKKVEFPKYQELGYWNGRTFGNQKKNK